MLPGNLHGDDRKTTVSSLLPDVFHLPPSRGLTAVRRARLDSPDPA